MIKFVLSISKYAISNQLKAIQQLKINKEKYQPLELRQKLWDLIQNLSHQDCSSFINIYKEFDYDYRDIAEFYNKNHIAHDLIVKKHQQNEAKVIIESAYQHLLLLEPTHLFVAEFDFENLKQYLNEEGLQIILSETQKDTLKRAYNKIIENTFYGLYLQAMNKGQDQIKLVEILKKLELLVLQEQNPNDLIWKTFIFSNLQGGNEKIINYFTFMIQNLDAITKKELIVFSQIVFLFSQKFGNYKAVSVLQKRLNVYLTKLKNELSLQDRLYFLIKSQKELDIINKQELICQQIYEQIRDIPIQNYSLCFKALCNFYWVKIKIVEEEEFIENNMEKFTKQIELIDLLFGLIYANSQNTKLIKSLFVKLQNLMEKSSTVEKCHFYQILYILENSYNLELNVENKEDLRSIYFNATNLKHQPQFSQANLDMDEILQQIQSELNNQKRPDWRITKIKKQANVQIYQVDFVVELEGIYRKRLIYLDFIQRHSYIDETHLIGKQRNRHNIFKTEEITFVDFKTWYSQEDKVAYVKQLLGL
ncbi:unnamed protein product [Paramecium sonneborni]|uniref:RAP domain-containing protein n=1 Tax=Paramecium sonneborni TaxID=65129 RepID=A0A8S1KWP2_9CILI|nr:unnamed protein product [Paramecium sonneborni]